MRVYNPTIDNMKCMCSGMPYYVDAGCYIDVSEEPGNWIIDKYKKFGLVQVDIAGVTKKQDITKYIVTKTLEGLYAYLEHLTFILGQYANLDTELKQQNIYGTVLKHPECQKVERKLAKTKEMIEKLETQHGISLKNIELEEKIIEVTESIAKLIKDSELDKEAQDLFNKQQAELDKIWKDVAGMKESARV